MTGFISMCLLAASAATAQTTSDVVNSVVDDSALESSTAGDPIAVGAIGGSAPIVVSEGQGYVGGGAFYSSQLGAHLRARYNTDSYGQTDGNLDIGTMKLFDLGNQFAFVDGQITLNDDTQVGYNIGVGTRFVMPNVVPFDNDPAKVAGVSVWADGSSSVNDNFFPQVGLSLELLGDMWDYRWNGYFPLRSADVGSFMATDSISFSSDFLVQETIASTDDSLTVTEFEIARRLGQREAWIFGGSYQLFGGESSEIGLKVGARGYLTPDLSVQLALIDDDIFGTTSVFNLTWFIGRTRSDYAPTLTVYDRIREPVIRNDYVAIANGSATAGVPLEGDLDGDGEAELIGIVHVDSTAAAGGDGSFESPLNMLSDIEANSGENSIILVHADSTFASDSAVLQDGQRLLGEGGGVSHTIPTTEFGEITIPETATGAMAAAIPSVTNTTGDVVTLATDTQEVSNLNIDGGARGIVAPAGALAPNLNNLTIANTTGNGIELTPASELVDGGDPDSTDDDTLRVRFQPVLSNLTFDNIGGDDINLDATSPEAGTVPIVESIAISDVTSTNGQGVGVNLANNVGTASISDYSHDGAAASTGGILLTNSAAPVSITDATIANQGGFGISVVGSDASHTFTGIDIQDTIGASLLVDGGASNVDFTGKITQGATGAAVLVQGGHTGTVNLFESTTDDGVIDATGGTGLQFNDADGTYTFVDRVQLDGGDAGIDILNGSDGTITLTEATITDPTGEAILVDGGEASLSLTGKITQNNAASTLLVQGGHNGTLTFNELETDDGIIDAFNGNGLQFNDADGAYVFNNAVVLNGTTNGADTGIDILNDSAGTFTFSDASITDPTGTAFNVEGGSAIATFTGDISQNNNAATVSVSGGHTGTLTFLGRDDDTDVITATNGTGLFFNNADGEYAFLGGATLDGSGAGADTGIDIVNDSAGTFTFSDTTITDPTGTAVNILGGEADVDFTGRITQSNNATTLFVGSGHTGTLTFNEVEADAGVISATNGNGLQFDNADGTYTFNDGVELNGGDAGIDILSDSDGTFTFADATITDPTGTALNVDGGDADVTLTGQITQSNNASAVSVSGGHSGTISLNEATSGSGIVTATNGDGLQFDNADGNYFFNDAVELNGGDAGIDILNGSAGVFTFATGSEINDPTGTGLLVDGSSADVNYNGTIDNDAGRAVVIDSNTGGSVSIGGQVTDTDLGVLVQDNTGGNFSFNGGVDLDTMANQAVTLTNNSGTTIAFRNVDIDTTTGNGFVASDSEGVAVLGSGNTIDTTTGTGLDLNNVEVGATGITFDSISVDGAVNGIVMNNVTGGAVNIGASGSSSGDGGVIQNTTGVGVDLTNVSNVSLNFMRIIDGDDNGVTIVHDNAAASNVTIADSVIRNSANQGVSYDATGSGTARLTLSGNTLDTNGDESIALNINGNASVANITINGNSVNNSSGEEALLLTGAGGTVKTINLLVDDNVFTNDDPTAVAADFQANGAVNLNATVLDNVFVNSDGATGRPMEMSANDGASSIRLSMFDNRSTAANGGDDYFLIQNAGSFSIENLTVPAVPPDEVPELTVEEANEGTINFSGSFTTDPGNVPRP